LVDKYTNDQHTSVETPVTPEWRLCNVLKIADRRGAHCAIASNTVCELCHRQDRLTVIILNMLKHTTADWRLHSLVGYSKAEDTV